MTKRQIPVPIRKVNGADWGDLTVFGHAHEVVGTVARFRPDISFIDGHRVRVVQFKKMVHFKVLAGTEIDISEVKTDRRRVVNR